MSVTHWTPQIAITVSPAAQEHFRQQLGKASHPVGIHFGVRKSGCSGWMYVVETISEAGADDHVIQIDEHLKIFVDSGSLAAVNGTHIDLVKQGLNYQLQFQNPNTDASCGCGESFSVKTAEMS